MIILLFTSLPCTSSGLTILMCLFLAQLPCFVIFLTIFRKPKVLLLMEGDYKDLEFLLNPKFSWFEHFDIKIVRIMKNDQVGESDVETLKSDFEIIICCGNATHFEASKERLLEKVGRSIQVSADKYAEISEDFSFVKTC